MYTCIHIHTHTYIYMYHYIYLFVYGCNMYVCMHACMHICVMNLYVCKSVCIQSTTYRDISLAAGAAPRVDKFGLGLELKICICMDAYMYII